MLLTIKDAVVASGVQERTLREWLAKGVLKKHVSQSSPRRKCVQIDSDELASLPLVRRDSVTHGTDALLSLLQRVEVLEHDRDELRARVAQLERQNAAESARTSSTNIPSRAERYIGSVAIVIGPDGAISKNTCARLGPPHGLSEFSTSKIFEKTSADERMTLNHVIQRIYDFMHRPTSQKAFSVCEASDCACHAIGAVTISIDQ